MATEGNHNERSYLLKQSASDNQSKVMFEHQLPSQAMYANLSTSSEAGQHSQPSNPFQDFAVETNYGIILQAAVFVEDAINYRSIHHKIDPVTLTRYHRPYYTRVVQWTINIVIAVYLLLAFFEQPSSLHLNSDYRGEKNTNMDPPCGVTEGIELLCLFVFMMDVLVQFRLIGWKRYIYRPWLVLYSFLIIVSLVDWTLSVSMVCGYAIRVRRLLRPFFLLQRSSIMKKMVNAIKKSLPQILSVLVLLLLVLYVFAMLGMLLFPRHTKQRNEVPILPNGTDYEGMDLEEDSYDRRHDNYHDIHQNYSAIELEGHLYFSSVRQAFVSLLVLLTTANNPDSMLPVYTENRFYALFFVIFVALGTYIILNLLTAVIYNQFRGYLSKSLQSSFFRRRVGLRAAFVVLSVRRRDPRNGLELEIVHIDTIRILLRHVQMKKKYLPMMINTVETMETNYFSWVQFRAIFDVLGKKTKSNSRSSDHAALSYIRLFARFQLIVRHKFFMYFTHFISVIHAVFITVVLIYQYDENFAHHDSMLMIGNFIFILYYSVELAVKILGLSVKGYLKQLGNIYEGFMTLLLIVLMIVYLVKYGSPINSNLRKGTSEKNQVMNELNRLIRVITIVVIFRLLRVVPHIQRLYVVVATVIDLISHLRGFMGIIVAVYYFFAILGMQLFSHNWKLEEIGPSNCTDRMIHTHQCTQYQQLTYYANNFHDFAAALIVLWDVMVVNNWYVFLDGYMWATGTAWAQLYFIAWWLVSVIICVNLFIALVLEAFVSRWEHVQRHEALDLYSSTQMASLNYDSYNYQQRDVQALLQEQLVEPHEADIMHELLKHHDMILYTNNG